MGATQAKEPLTERQLREWEPVRRFRACLERALERRPAGRTWADPRRELAAEDYLSLLLFGLFNPVVKTMRGLCAASGLQRVQEEICGRAVSLGSFSEAQAVLEPELLAEVFAELGRQVRPEPGPAGRAWLVQDSSLFEALPRMHWALWRRQDTTQAQVRLHLSLDLASASPCRVEVTPGKGCERRAWRKQWRKGDCWIGDRYFGEDYRQFALLAARGITFLVRVRQEAVVNVTEELAVSAADRAQGVVRAARAWLGSRAQYRSQEVRVVWVQAEKEPLVLVTNLAAEELGGAEVALLYRRRWQIELFFRWLKCLLGCRHWFAESPRGVTLQLYLALIAALLLQLYTGQRPNRRQMELIQWYLAGMASETELGAGLVRLARAKKS